MKKDKDENEGWGRNVLFTVRQAQIEWLAVINVCIFYRVLKGILKINADIKRML